MATANISILNSAPREKPATYRSGIAALMAGLPVETLRVWERRYQLSETARSPRGQRLYSEQQIARLKLIKRAVDQGHPISGVAALPDATLNELTIADGVLAQRVAAIRVMLVGRHIAQRLATRSGEPRLEVVHSCATLEGAGKASADLRADLLLIELPEPQASDVPLITALRERSGARCVLVLYRFCRSATVRLLRDHGCVVARAPSDAEEIALLCAAALAERSMPAIRRPLPTAQRRIDDQALTALTALPLQLKCECPAHLAEILLMLSSFERYSLACEQRNEDDAAVHRELGYATAQARTVLEAALEQLAEHEGLVLPIRARVQAAIPGDTTA